MFDNRSYDDTDALICALFWIVVALFGVMIPLAWRSPHSFEDGYRFGSLGLGTLVWIRCAHALFLAQGPLHNLLVATGIGLGAYFLLLFFERWESVLKVAFGVLILVVLSALTFIPLTIGTLFYNGGRHKAVNLILMSAVSLGVFLLGVLFRYLGGMEDRIAALQRSVSELKRK